MATSVLTQDKQKFAELQKVVEEYKGQEGSLMPILHTAQEIYGYLPLEVQNYIAEELGIPLTDVYGVATFYSQFTLKPKGQYKIGLCMGTACYVKGAQKVLDKLQEVLNIEVGDTTDDGKFTLEATRCLGACGLAPVMMLNEEVYGRLTPDDIADIIAKYKDE